jgi:hypothetical protein
MGFRNCLMGLLAAIFLWNSPQAYAQQDVLTCDFVGTEPAWNTPWTQTTTLDFQVRFDGWVLGPGSFPEAGVHDAFATYLNAGATESTLSEAINDGEYVGFTMEGVGEDLNLNGNEITFSVRRAEWFSPTQVSLFSSVDGFQVGQELFTSTAVTQGFTEEQAFTYSLPAFGYEDLSGPVEFRLYYHGATYANHFIELTSFHIYNPNPADRELVYMANLIGSEPASHTPWTPHFFLKPGWIYYGLELGAGATPEPLRNNAFGFNVTSGQTETDLAEAIANDHYLSLTFESATGRLNLNGHELRFGMKRYEWTSPRAYSVLTSVDGFQTSEVLYTTPSLANGDYVENSFLYSFPLAGYDQLSGPVEIRIYAHEAQYALKAIDLTHISIFDASPTVERDVFQADFLGNEPALNTPWQATAFLDPNVQYSGLTLGGGVTPVPLHNDQFSVQMNAGPVETSLADALAKDHYVSFVLGALNGDLDLGGRELRFDMKREDWNAPRAYSLLTSIDGFQESAALLQSAPSLSGDFFEHDFRYTFPLSGYDDISGPVEFRIYYHHALFANKPISLTRLSLLDAGDVADFQLTAAEGGIAWADPFGNTLPLGKPVTLYAKPDMGYQFAGWSGDVTGLGNPRTVMVNSNMSVTANFRSIEFPEMRLGTNLEAAVDWSKQWIWVDQMKVAREWMTRRVGTTDWESFMQDEIPLDADGWPTVVPFTASDGFQHYVHTMLPAFVPGTHTMLVDGTGELEFLGANTRPSVILSGGTTTVTIDVLAGNTEALFVRILSSSAGDPVRNIRVLMPGFESTYQTDPLHPQFVAGLDPFQALRFMDLSSTNHSPLQTAADRRLPNWYTQAGKMGIAAEWIADISNQLQKDAWICIPHQADDAYVREIAIILRDRLDPTLKLHVEYSNETWNGLFTQTAYVQDQGMLLGLDTARWDAGQKFVAMRSAQIWHIFEQEFADDSRLIKVLATQSPNAVISEQRLTALSDYDLNPHGVMADALAIAPYFGRTFTLADIPPLAPAYPTVDDMLDVMAVQDIQRLQGEVRAQRALADHHGLTLLCYEGGQHFVGMNGAENDTALVSLIEDANRDPRMKSLYLDYLDTLATERIDDFNQFIYTGGWSKWGSWGALEYQDQPMQDAPKYAALVEWEQLRLTADRDTISINGGTAVAFSLSGGPLRAGRGYQVLATSSGRFPGTILPSAQILPLNTDDFSNTVRDMTNQGPFRDFMGTFDSSGKAIATLNLGPLNAGMLDQTMHFAFAEIGPWGFPSNPVAILLVL